MEELIDEFTVATEDGDTVTLSVYQEVIPAGHYGDPAATVRGLMRIEDENGRAVNYLGDGRYLIVATGVNATGRDPA